MKPEKQNLIRDLLEDDSRREETLLTGARILRRRRHWRAVRPAAALLALLLGVVIFWLRRETSHPALETALKTAPKAPPTAPAQPLTDDELLSLFPNTPVGLASLPDGKKRLIFPRPGDEQRFITKL
jgi:hypothetical protein